MCIGVEEDRKEEHVSLYICIQIDANWNDMSLRKNRIEVKAHVATSRVPAHNSYSCVVSSRVSVHSFATTASIYNCADLSNVLCELVQMAAAEVAEEFAKVPGAGGTIAENQKYKWDGALMGWQAGTRRTSFLVSSLWI